MPKRQKDSSKKHRRFDQKIYDCFAERRDTKVRFEGPDIFYTARGSVVTVWVETEYSGTGPDQFLTEVGSGFFVGHLTIVTSAHVVMYNNVAQNRVPPVDQSHPLFARGGKISVRVTNVNGKGEAYFYPAELIGVCPSMDIAVIKICQDDLPKCVPCIKCQPVLKWGCSRKMATGEKVYILGDALNQYALGLTEGVVTDSIYADPELSINNVGQTYWGFEGVITDADAVSGNSGGPLLDSMGQVIGVVSGVDYNVFGTGNQFNVPFISTRTVTVAQHVAERVVNALVAGPADKCLGGYIQIIEDPLGNYFRMKYGWLGVTSFISMSPEILTYVPNSDFAKHQGFVIRECDPTSPLYQFFRFPYQNWGQVPIVPPTSDNEIYLLTRIECDKVGTAMGQVPISSVTLWKVPGQEVTIYYRLGSDNFCREMSCCIELGEMPIDLDLPPAETSTVSQINGATRSAPRFGQGTTPSGRHFTKDIGLDLFNLLQIYGTDLGRILQQSSQTSPGRTDSAVAASSSGSAASSSAASSSGSSSGTAALMASAIDDVLGSAIDPV